MDTSMFHISYLIILINIIVTLWAWRHPYKMEELLEVPYEIVHKGKYYQLLTSAFLHGDYVHLIFNMMTLYFFGPFIEHVLGSVNFILIYFISLFSSSLLSVLLHHNNPSYRSLGASGAVGGIVFSFVALFPMENLYIFFIPFGIPAFIYGFVFLAYTIGALQTNIQDGISHSGHLGGAVAGLIMGLFFRLF